VFKTDDVLHFYMHLAILFRSFIEQVAFAWKFSQISGSAYNQQMEIVSENLII